MIPFSFSRPLPQPAEGVEVRLDDAQRAITPGEGAVFYDSEIVLGGGWLE